MDPFSGSSTAVTQIVFWRFESCQPSQIGSRSGAGERGRARASLVKYSQNALERLCRSDSRPRNGRAIFWSRVTAIEGDTAWPTGRRVSSGNTRPASTALILIVNLAACYLHNCAHAQTPYPKWGAPAQTQGATDRAVEAANERQDCYKFPNGPSERCRVQREDDRRPSEKHHERQVHERRWY